MGTIYLHPSSVWRNTSHYSLLWLLAAGLSEPRMGNHAFPLRLSCAETCCGLRRALEPAAGYAGLSRRRGNDGLWIKAPTPPTITPGFYDRVG